MATVRNNRVNSDVPASTTRTEVFAEINANSGNSMRATSNMMSAIYSALFIDSDTVNTDPNTYGTSVMPDCPTGNCDIPPFQTLAICSRCSDISHLLNTKEEKACQSSIFSLFLPNGLHLNRTRKIPDLVSTSAESQGGMEGLSGIENFGPSALLNLSSISIPGRAPLSNATATHCSLYWCVNTYSASMKDNRAEETLVDTYHDAGAQYDSGPLTLRPSVKGNLTATNFTVYSFATETLNEWLVDKLQFNNTPQIWCDSRNDLVMKEPKENEFLQIILNAPLSDSFEKIAAGMTKHVRGEQRRVQSYHGNFARNFSYPAIEPAHGTSWTVQTQLHVRWTWIILPVLLIILTIIFLTMTALQSRRRRLDIWKSSTIPLLCSQLHPNIQQKIKAVGDPMQTEDIASRVYVRSVRILKSENTGDAWRLDAHDSVSRSR